MRIGQELRQGAEQRLLLLPKMLQAIEVLQLPVEDLAERVEQAISENEALVAVPTEATRASAALPARRAAREERADHLLESAPAHGEGLIEHLSRQVALAALDRELEDAVMHVIAHVDPATGWLVAEESALAASFGRASDAALWSRAIAYVQQLEPRGVGGRGSIECLLLQLDPADPQEEVVRRVLVDFLEDVSKNRLPKVAKRLGISVEELRASLEHARGLRLRPGAEFESESAAQVRPDVIVEWTASGFEVEVEHGPLPRLSIDEDVSALARDRRMESSARSYWRERVDAARDLIDALEQRRATLARVARALFAAQRAFLAHGPDHVEPLRMQQIADRLSIHVSTVSRAVAGKWAATPWGLFSLRSFFSAGLVDEEGHEHSRAEIQVALRAVLAEEDRGAPLSDDDIVRVLAQRHGLDVARRTVAKYRKELGIPSSWRRRLH
ncbi:MAG: RNA polymerase factor sigma-54 [Planctomycetes bacterium]|nr:RNA polymerase factor sigma-54 [Planctomycetota bacterium]